MVNRVILICLILCSQRVAGQTITTVAGGSTYGLEPFAENGLFPWPGSINSQSVVPGYCIAVDNQGNICFSTILDGIHRIKVATQQLEFFAGGGTVNNGDGGLAMLAGTDYTQSMAFDAQGNLYLSHYNRIRKIDAATGVITIYAGTGVGGFSGDGGLATAAMVSSPRGLTTDAGGNLYFFDGGNFIRRVDVTTKIISTIAGGGADLSSENIPATSADIGDQFADLACDALGNVLTTDLNRIRKIDTGTGLIATISGDPSAGFAGDGGPASQAKYNTVSSIAVNAAGDIFIVDGGNQRLRKISSANGNVSTIAGTGVRAESGTVNGDGGSAVLARINATPTQTYLGTDVLSTTPDGSVIFFEQLPHRIRRIDPSGTIRLLYGSSNYLGNSVPATEASLAAPSGLCIYEDELYIGDQGTYKVRKVNLASGIITDVAGLGYQTTIGDNGPALSAGLGNVFEVKPDADGNLFVVDYGNAAIRRIDKITGVMTTFAGTLGVPGFAGDGGPANLAKMGIPSAIVFDSNGDLYISDRANSRIRKVDKATGIISTVAGIGTVGFSGDGGPASQAKFDQVSALHFAPNGDLLLSDRVNHRVRKIDRTTGVITTIIGNGTTTYPGDGFGPLEIGLDFPYGIAHDEVGNLIIADANLNRILRLSNGKVETIAGTGVGSFSGDNGPASEATLKFPRDIFYVPGGTLYVADNLNNRIRKITDIVTGLERSNESTSLMLYPNPATQSAVIKLQKGGVKSVDLIDAMGKAHPIEILVMENQATIDVRSLPAGLYLARVRTNDGVHTVKMVKVNP